MKNLSILEMQLLSRKERKAKKVIFDRRRTLILGKNHTGKSSLMKSIYHTFGADPQFHPNFKNAAVATSVKFNIDNNILTIVRDGKNFGIFDDADKIIHKFDSVTKGLGIFLSQLFNFKPLLQTSTQDFIIPPPAYLFLPYYIDQDESWYKSWASFTKLQQIKDYRTNMILYHSGIRPNEYYSVKKDAEEANKIIEEIEKEKDLTGKILKELKETISQTNFNIDIERFKDEIKELLVECETLKKREETLKQKLLDLYNIKAIVESQVAIVQHSIQENKKDLVFASKNIPHFVDCPTCGAQYENSFTERFEIANDEQTGNDLLIDLSKELKGVEESIIKENGNLTSTSTEIQRIESILELKQGEVQLKDVLDNYGKNQVHEIFKARIKDLNHNLHQQAERLMSLNNRLKALEDKEKREKIVGDFTNNLTKYLKELDIHSLSPDDYKVITTKIESKETGSSKPRALIAYYYAFFQLMQRYSTTTFCPIVIDSPNQQDQDVEHIDKIMAFINNNQPKNTQMILGLAETYGVDFDCQVIELKEKYSLLQSDEYNTVNTDLGNKLNQLWFM